MRFLHYSQSWRTCRPLTDATAWFASFPSIPTPLPFTLCSGSWIVCYANHTAPLLHLSGPPCLLFFCLNALLLQCGQLFPRNFPDPPRQIRYLPTGVCTCSSSGRVVKIWKKVVFVSRLDLTLSRAVINSCPDLHVSTCGSVGDSVACSPSVHPLLPCY